METTMENTVNNTEGQLTKKEIEAQERAKRRAEKETQQLADNKYRIEKVFDNDRWLRLGEVDGATEEFAWKHTQIPLIVKVKNELPIKGNGSHQVEGGFYNDYFPLKKNDKGFYLVDYTVRKIETKGYYGSAGRFGDTINYLVRHLKKVEEAEARERDLKDFQELGWDGFVKKQTEEELTIPLLKEVYLEFSRIYYDYHLGSKKEEGWNDGGWNRDENKRNTRDTIDELLYLKVPTWKSDYRDNEVFWGELKKIKETNGEGLINRVYTLKKRDNEQKEDEIIKKAIDEWLNDETKAKYINLYQEKLKGNGQENETIVNQAIKEVKALIGEIDIYISDRSIEYDIKRHLISFKELAQRNIEEEKKDWTAEQWKVYAPLGSNGEPLSSYYMEMKNWDEYWAESYFRGKGVERENCDREVIRLREKILAGEDFEYKCKFCQEAGDSLFKQGWRGKYTVIYQCSRCENTEYKMNIQSLKEAIEKAQQKKEEE